MLKYERWYESSFSCFPHSFPILQKDIYYLQDEPQWRYNNPLGAGMYSQHLVSLQSSWHRVTAGERDNWFHSVKLCQHRLSQRNEKILSAWQVQDPEAHKLHSGL